VELYQRIRQQVAREHHELLEPNDPILMMITMNELLIANYLEQFNAMQETQQDELRKSLLTVVQHSETISTQLINRSLVAMQENYEAKEKAFAAQVEAAGQKMVDNVRQEVLGFQKARNTFEIIAYSIALVLAFILGIMVKTVFWH